VYYNLAYGQNTSLNNYGAEKTTDNSNICAEYKPDCDNVPQNKPIPFSEIP